MGQTFNAAKADITGLEVEAVALLTESFRDIGLSWLDAEYDEYFRFDPADPSSLVSLAGNKLSQAPEFTANIGLSYNQDISDYGSLKLRVDYYYSDEVFQRIQQSSFSRQL